MTKDKRAHWMILLQAAAITMLFHLLLFFGFCEEPAKQIEETVAYRRISLLPAQGKGEMAPEQIKLWMDYHDPTLIAKSNERYGYGNLLVVRGWRDELTVPGPMQQVRRPVFAAFGHGVGEDASAASNNNMHNWLATLSRAPLKPQPAVDIRYPRIFNATGDEIMRGTFENSLPEVAAELKRLPPLSSTVLQINVEDHDRLPRYTVRNSCGNRNLDQMALRTIMQRNDLGGHEQLTVTWPEAPEVKK